MATRRRAAARPDVHGSGSELHIIPSPEQLLAEARKDRRAASMAQAGAPEALGWPTTVFMGAVAALGVLAIGFFAHKIDSSDLLGLLLLTALAGGAARFNVTVYGETRLDVSFVAIFAAAVLYGAPGVVIVGAAAAASVHFPGTILSPMFLFNVGNATLLGTSTALTFHALALGHEGEVHPILIPAALAAAGVAYAVNAFLVTQLMALTTRRSLYEVWAEKGRWLFPHYLVLGFLGLALALAYDALGIVGLLAFAAPPAMMQLAIKQYIDRTTENVAALRRKNEELESANRDLLEMSRRLRDTYHGTLEALVTALDARDRETKGHSARVCAYTLDIAREIGVEEGSNEWIDMQRAALLHDVGKIGVTDFILHKPGPLSPEEWQEMRRHPDIGYEMLKEVTFLRAPAEIVRFHHERYDGKGYPRGIKGEKIPLGARIFAVADTFDAMTSDRPYRRALPPEAAREEIIRNSGSQFDHQVVKAFLTVYERWVERRAPAKEQRRAA